MGELRVLPIHAMRSFTAQELLRERAGELRRLRTALFAVDLAADLVADFAALARLAAADVFLAAGLRAGFSRSASCSRVAVFHSRSRSDRKSTRLNSSHLGISYAVFCLKKKTRTHRSMSRKGCPNGQRRLSTGATGV